VLLGKILEGTREKLYLANDFNAALSSQFNQSGHRLLARRQAWADHNAAHIPQGFRTKTFGAQEVLNVSVLKIALQFLQPAGLLARVQHTQRRAVSCAPPGCGDTGLPQTQDQGSGISSDRGK